MELTPDNRLRKLIVVGDRVLIKPDPASERTKTGLYLPQGIQEKEVVQRGTIVRVGPGYPVPHAQDDYDEPWKEKTEQVKYLPLQAKEGDTALYMQRGAIELIYNDEKYVIVQQHAILMLLREEDLP